MGENKTLGRKEEQSHSIPREIQRSVINELAIIYKNLYFLFCQVCFAVFPQYFLLCFTKAKMK